MGNQWGDATLALGMTKYLKLIYGFSTANVKRNKDALHFLLLHSLLVETRGGMSRICRLILLTNYIAGS